MRMRLLTALPCLFALAVARPSDAARTVLPAPGVSRALTGPPERDPVALALAFVLALVRERAAELGFAETDLDGAKVTS